MRHLYECPMRWADLDLLGHVNNVVFVDYLQEARVDMLRTHAADRGAENLVGGPGEGTVVVRHVVDYVRPLTFRFRPVLIECWVTQVRAASFTLAYEIFDETDGERTVYARATTVLTPFVFATERPRRLTPAERETLHGMLEPTETPATEWSDLRRADGGHFPLHVRFSDVDVYGHVNNVKYFEYFQEARIRLMDELGRSALGPDRSGQESGVVVARQDVDYRRPIHFRERPYDVWSWVSHVGSRSMVVEAQVRDEESVLSRARVVMVFFDPETQRSTEPSPALRERLLAAVRGPAS